MRSGHEQAEEMWIHLRHRHGNGATSPAWQQMSQGLLFSGPNNGEEGRRYRGEVVEGKASASSWKDWRIPSTTTFRRMYLDPSTSLTLHKNQLKTKMNFKFARKKPRDYTGNYRYMEKLSEQDSNSTGNSPKNQ